MEVKLLGKTFDVKRVINKESHRCDVCKKETKECVKLYVENGSLLSCCVELA